MEAGEWVAIGVAAVSLSATVLLEVMRIRRDRRREAAAAEQSEAEEERAAALRDEQFLLQLEVALNALYLSALEHLRPGDGSYATASLLKRRLVDAGEAAEHAPGNAAAMSAHFVKTCGEIVGWIDRGAAEEEKELLRQGVQDTFESAVRAVAALRAQLRDKADPTRGRLGDS